MKKFYEGFTLTEILVVTAILLILSAVSVPFYSYFQSDSMVESSKDEVIDVLRLAQAKAKSEEGGVYGVYFQSQTFSFYEGNDYATRIPTSERVFNFPSGVTASGLSEVNFSLIGVPDSSGTITLSSNSGEKRSLVITSIGLIHEVSSEIATIYATEDSYLSQTVSSGNYGNQADIQVYPRNIGYNKRGILRFELGSIPAGAIINSATVYLRESATFGMARTLALHRVTRNWKEDEVTWSKADSSNTWISVGGDYVVSPSATAMAAWSGVLDWDSWSVTSDVQQFVNQIVENYGWILKDIQEDTSEAYWYFSSRQSSYRPYIVINYSL